MPTAARTRRSRRQSTPGQSLLGALVLFVLLLAVISQCGDSTPTTTSGSAKKPTTTTTIETETEDVAPAQPAEAAASPRSTSISTHSLSGSGDDEDSGSAYYKNCAAARAAGATPLYIGDPGYRSGLDRDGDGVACE
ncbi:MAG: excalibur calcium-binding domain-containing protein [Pseudonocardiaceae bacterium]